MIIQMIRNVGETIWTPIMSTGKKVAQERRLWVDLEEAFAHQWDSIGKKDHSNNILETP